MDIIGVKVIVLFLLGLTKVGFGLLPLLLHKYLTKRNKLKCLDRFIGLVLCVGGGILLSTVFIHMIKEVRESLEAATQTGVLGSMDFEYPFAELLICMGFLLIFLVESIVHKFFGDHHHPPPASPTPASSRKPSFQPQVQQIKSASGGSRGVDNQAYIMDDAEIYPDTSESNSTCSWSTQTNGSLTRSNDVKLRAAPLSEEHPDTALRASRSPFITTKKSDKNVYNVSSATLTSYASFDSDIGAGLESQVSSNLRVPATSTLRGNYVGSSNSRGSTSSNNSITREKSFVASIRGFLIVLALSIHSLFEGMAIGLEETDQGVWKLFTAVIIHSVAIVFCIGTEMISSGMKKKTIIIYMIVLGVNSPIGVLIGLIVTLHVESASPAHLLAVGVLQGLAAGTLLYITFFEVLSREKLTRYRMTGIIGVLAIALGFTVMAVMEGTGSHTHSHGGPAPARRLGGSGLNHSGHNHIHVEEILGSKEDAFNFNPYQNEQLGHSHDHRHHEYHHHHDHEESNHFTMNKMKINSENKTFHLSDHNHESHDHGHGSHNHTKDFQDHDHEHDDHRNETHAHDDHQTDGHNHDVHKHDDHTHENHEDDDNEHKEHDYDHHNHDNHNDHGHEHEHSDHEHSDPEHSDHEHDDHENMHDGHEHKHDDHEHKHDDHEHEHDDHEHEHKAHAQEQFEHSEDDHGHIIHEHEYDEHDHDLSETMNIIPVQKSGENIEDDILDVTDLLSGVQNSSRQGDLEVFVDG